MRKAACTIWGRTSSGRCTLGRGPTAEQVWGPARKPVCREYGDPGVLGNDVGQAAVRASHGCDGNLEGLEQRGDVLTGSLWLSW